MTSQLSDENFTNELCINLMIPRGLGILKANFIHINKISIMFGMNLIYKLLQKKYIVFRFITAPNQEPT